MKSLGQPVGTGQSRKQFRLLRQKLNAVGVCSSADDGRTFFGVVVFQRRVHARLQLPAGGPPQNA